MSGFGSLHPFGSGGSSPSRANDTRETVYCHACQNDWLRDNPQASLECPRCGSDITEIIDPDSDPRGMSFNTPSDGSSGPHFRRPGGSDSDPDEQEIYEHLFRGPSASRYSTRDTNSGPHVDVRVEGRTAEGPDPIMSRFAEMLMQDLGAARALRNNNTHTNFPEPGTAGRDGVTTRRTTFISGPSGITITSSTSSSGGGFTVRSGVGGVGDNGSGSRSGSGSPRGDSTHPIDPTVPMFSSILNQILGGVALPPGATPTRPAMMSPFGVANGPEGTNQRGAPVPLGLHDILMSIFNPGGAMSGDIVHSQEELDRIITQLMEASPQTNAAPPASQSAIERLTKRTVDDAMLGAEGKAECTICIDEINKGDQVTELPCKHWYHGECVVLWLKEHNTCPICRMPIEGGGDGGGASSSAASGGAAAGSSSASGSNNGNGSGSNRQGEPSRQTYTRPFSFSFGHSPSQQAAQPSTSDYPSDSLFSAFSRIGSQLPGSSASASGSPSELAYMSNDYRSSVSGQPRTTREIDRRHEERLQQIREAAGLDRTSASASRTQSGEGLRRRNSNSPPSDTGHWTRGAAAREERRSERRRESGFFDSFRENRDRDQRDDRESERHRDGSGRNSQQSRESSSQSSNNGSSGHGPLSWLRGHFMGRGNDRDRRR